MTTQLLQIGSLTFNFDELVLEEDKFAIKKSVENKPNTEYQLGVNKSFYPIKLISSEFFQKYDFTLRLSREKFLQLDTLFYNQKQVAFSNFDPEIDNVYNILLEFKSSLSKKQTPSFCSIDSLEILDSFIKNDVVYYEVNVIVIEF